jgi:hypothetical protein
VQNVASLWLSRCTPVPNEAPVWKE